MAGIRDRIEKWFEGFALRMAGWIRVPADGVWRFALASDDGAVLRVA